MWWWYKINIVDFPDKKNPFRQWLWSCTFLMVKFVLCSQVIEIKVKGFTCRDAFQRQKLLPQSMLHIYICTFLSLMMSLFLSSYAKGFHKYFDHWNMRASLASVSSGVFFAAFAFCVPHHLRPQDTWKMSPLWSCGVWTLTQGASVVTLNPPKLASMWDHYQVITPSELHFGSWVKMEWSYMYVEYLL